jgi:hypothetical protein
MSDGPVLSEAQRRSWTENGYVLLPQAVPADQVAATVAAIWEFLGMRPTEPADWYDADLRQASGIDPRGMIPMYHHQALWDCRQSPVIYAAFSELLGRSDLAVSIDRVNMNPPATADWEYEGFIHWDIDVSVRPIGVQPQGLLALSDAADDAGGFRCVPGFHRGIEDWLDRQPAGYATRFPETTGMDIRSLPMRAGDFLIWHGALPHGNSRNNSDRPRLAQYITMRPASELDETARCERLRSFAEGCAPRSFQAAQLPEPRRAIPAGARLSPLGLRLLGAEPW